jgi:sphingomyelin phosphodiesterase acid-like 3
MRLLLNTVIAVLAMVVGTLGVSASQPSGHFGVISDIHFDPFEPAELAKDLQATDLKDWGSRLAAFNAPSAVQRGRDTTSALLLSALVAIAEELATADFVLFTGDFLGHRFDAYKSSKVVGIEPPAGQSSFAQKTVLFVIGALREALPGKPIMLALGNNDSDCGDYAIQPRGAFLAATSEAVKAVSGAGNVSADFGATYGAGGYYEVRHPTVRNAKILVLNDVLWSRYYENRCGTTGLDAGRKQLEWLKAQLLGQEERGGTVWLVHHIPWGIDAYSTGQARADSCQARIVPFLRDDIAIELLSVLRRYAHTISASFSGHTHYDDFRLLSNSAGGPVVVDKVIPAISPIAGQNPAFQVFTYEISNGALVDYTTRHLTNLEAISPTVPGEWREEYTFTKAYRQARFSPSAVKRLHESLGETGPIRGTYYNQRRSMASASLLKAYACAIAHVDAVGFGKCYCPASKR